ncbi:MAG TPA: hypothetical protein VFN07_00990 [Trueperaceae bacterium]|nr:hypothetical protein [Trueperaceae bacterium]
MADTAVVVGAVPLDSFSSVIGAATAISAGDTAVIAAGGFTGRLLLQVTNTTAAKDVTIKAGVGPRAALGDLVLEFGATETRYIAIESARFAQANGSIRVTMEGAGSVRASRLPAGS